MQQLRLARLQSRAEGVKTFVEDATDDKKDIKDITITELTPKVLEGEDIKLKLSGNWKFLGTKGDEVGDVSFLNEKGVTAKAIKTDDDTIEIRFDKGIKFEDNMLSKMTIEGIYIQPTKKCEAGDVATITVSSMAKSKEFSNVKLEVAKMVKEAVTYSVEDKDLPVIWSGAYNDDTNTLKVSVEENTGDILNTSRKATFTFPEGIEVAGVRFDGVDNIRISNVKSMKML